MITGLWMLFAAMGSMSAHAVQEAAQAGKVSRAEATREGVGRAGAERARDTLVDVSAWGRRIGPGFRFARYDEGGLEVGGPVERGSFVRIHAPGDPAPDYWVRVIELEDSRAVGAPEGDIRLTLEVAPTWDPTERPTRPGRTAHFFTRDARNRFVLAWSAASGRLEISVNGRSERANVTEVASRAEGVRNRLVAETLWGVRRHAGSAGLGPQKLMWEVFTEHLAREALDR